jgi:hypothetical protein
VVFQSEEELTRLGCIQEVAEQVGATAVASKAKEMRLERHGAAQTQKVRDAVLNNMNTVVVGIVARSLFVFLVRHGLVGLELA